MTQIPDQVKMEKEPILMLVHRIPFPPNKGDKIRSFHLLTQLAQQYTVHLGCFVDDPNDVQYQDTLSQWCATSHFVQLRPSLAKLKSILGFFMNMPLSFAYYRNTAFQAWVHQTLMQYSIQKIMVFSSAMAQFVDELPDHFRVIDFVDMDSDKWQQYAEKKSWLMRSLYRREAKVLLTQEVRIAASFDAGFFVSREEADLFVSRAPHLNTKVSYFNNGVDTDYFSPDREYDNPYPATASVIVFTGAMDYWPNIDAVQWFCAEMFPALRAQHPDLLFYIVGARPTSEVSRLAQISGVTVTGSVPDVRPFIAHACASVAPLRIARGIQNKVLEAMAMAKVVVVSPQALEGIEAVPGEEVILAQDAADFVVQIHGLLKTPGGDMAAAARRKVTRRYNWESNLRVLTELLDVSTTRHCI